MNEDKIFIGSGKIIKTNHGFEFLSQSICQEDSEGYWKKAKNGKHYLNFSAVPKKNPDQYGNTHYLAINTYEGKNGNNREEEKVEEEKLQEEIDKEELKNNTCSEEEEEINPDDIPF